MKWLKTKAVHLLLMLLAVAAAPRAGAVGTTAGTQISNQAQIEFTPPSGITETIYSNMASFRVDEKIDVTVSRNDANDVSVSPSATSQPLSFRITNNGNGQEAFSLSNQINLIGDQFDPAAARIALDTNGNGQYDPSIDQLYSPGQNEPLLSPDQSTIVFLLCDIPAALQNGDRSTIALIATSATGTGPPGTSFVGKGDGGVDAVTGATTAQARDQSTYVVALVDTQFQKTQSVVDPQGGNTAVPGSVITYTLTTRITGNGQLVNAVVNDPLPAQTTYITGSLRLNGIPLTDTADSDAGQMNGQAVQVALGTLTAPATQTITFQVKLN